MADASGPRRLAAVLAADLPGHARDKTRDPRGAVDRARAFGELTAAAVRAANGTVRNAVEGQIVAEFASALDAVGCARGLLSRVAERNAGQPDAGRMQVRCAVHVGEFLVAGESLAAEALAWPVHLLSDADAGGLALTRDAWEEVRRQIPMPGRMTRPRRARDLPAGTRAWIVPPADAWFPAWTVRRGGWKTAAAVVVIAAAGAAAFRLSPRSAGGSGPAVAAPQPAVSPGDRIRPFHECEHKDRTFTYAGDGGAVTFEFIPDGLKGGAVKLVHGTTRPGSFWGFVFQAGDDWSGYTGLRISMKSAAGRPVRIQLIEDASGEDWVTELSPPPAWTTYEIPFTRLVPRADFNPGVRDGVLNLSRVRVLEIIQASSPVSDTLWVDELSLYGTAPARP